MREITFYEVEEFTVDKEVPVVVPTVNIVSSVQPTVTTVPTVETVTHTHEVLHDVNFGLSEESQAALRDALVTEESAAEESAAEESAAEESASQESEQGTADAEEVVVEVKADEYVDEAFGVAQAIQVVEEQVEVETDEEKADEEPQVVEAEEEEAENEVA